MTYSLADMRPYIRGIAAMLETISGSIMVTPLDAREEVCLEAGDIVSSTMPEEADLCPMTELRATGRRPSAPGANPDAHEMAERTRAPVRAFLELLLELPVLIGVIILIEMTWLFSLACSFSTIGFERELFLVRSCSIC